MNDACILVSDCDMVGLEEFLPELQVAFGTMPDEILASHVRDAAIKFCEKTMVVKQDLLVPLQCGVPDVILEPMCGMRIVSVDKLAPGCPQAPAYEISTGRLARLSSVCDASSARFVPPSILHLTPAPSQDREDGMWVRVSVAPDRDACDVPRELYQRYREVIQAGVKGVMYLLKGQDWYDFRLAEKFEKAFIAGCTVANVERLLNHKRGPVQARPRHRIA